MESREDFFDALGRGDRDRVRTRLLEDPSLAQAFVPGHFNANPVSVAVARGDLDMVDLLLEHGADIDLKSDWWAGGFAPIHSIRPREAEWMLPALLERGARWDIHAAATHARMDLIEGFLAESPDAVNEPGSDGRPPLSWAATPEVAAFLLERGARLEQRCVDHRSTPAQWAAPERPDVCRYLIEAGAATDPWMLAAVGLGARLAEELDGHPERIGARLPADFQRGPGDVSHIYTFTFGTGVSLLHVAAQRNQVDVVRMLLDRDGDPNARGGYDDATPLHLAAWEGHAEVVEVLLARGAAPDLKSGRIHRNEPLGWAIVGGRPEVVRILVEHGVTIQPWHRTDAVRGVGGDFKGWNTASADDYRTISSYVPPMD